MISAKSRRGALVLPPLLLVVALVLVPADTGADGPGGQSSTYTAIRQDLSACAIFSPEFASDTAALLNDTSRSADVAVEVRDLDAGSRYDRTLNIGALAAEQVTERSLQLPLGFSVGSFRAQVATPTFTPTVPALAVGGEGGGGGGGEAFEEGTLTPTTTATLTATPTVTGTLTDTPIATPTGSSTATATATGTLTDTPTATATGTLTDTPTATATGTQTNTPTGTLTNTPTATNTSTASKTPTGTLTNTPTRTRTPTLTRSATATVHPSITATATRTRTPDNGGGDGNGDNGSDGDNGDNGDIDDNIWFEAAQWIPIPAFPTLTPVPTATLVKLPSPTPLPRVTATPTLIPGCGLQAILYRDTATGDRWSLEAIPEIDSGPIIFIPTIHRADRGYDTDVVIFNVARSSDAHVDLLYRGDQLSERGLETELATVIIPAQSSVKLVLPGVLPRGLSSLEINGRIGTQLIAAAYHIGPQEAAASAPGLTRNNVAQRVALPVLFRNAGYGNGYHSMVRVMKVFPGAAEPTIMFRDQATGESIGPIPAFIPGPSGEPSGQTKVVREGFGHTWDLRQIPGLRDGRVYSAIVSSETTGEIAVTVEHVNQSRGTLSAYNGSAIRSEWFLPPEPYTNPVTQALIPQFPRGVPGAPGGPYGPPFLDPAILAAEALAAQGVFGGEPAEGAAAVPGAAGGEPAEGAATTLVTQVNPMDPALLINPADPTAPLPIPGTVPTPVLLKKELPKRLTAPLVVKNRDGLNSGIAVQNLGSQEIGVIVDFYDTGGKLVLAHAAKNIEGYGSGSIYLPMTELPHGFVGSADISASGPIAAVVHTARYR